MAVKPTKHADYKEVTYNSARWQLLKELRSKAEEVMAALEAFHLAVDCAWKHSQRRRKERQRR